MPIEQRWLYSNRSYWYPQSTVTDYATARLRITVPSDLDVVATGRPGSVAADDRHGGPDRERSATPQDVRCSMPSQPSRYLALVISRLDPITSTQMVTGRTQSVVVIRAEQPAAGRPGPEPDRKDHGGVHLLRVARRRRPVPEFHACAASRAIAREDTARRTSRCSTRSSSARRSRGGTIR